MIAPALMQHQFPAGDGELSLLVRGFNWSATELGSISGWPEYLKNAVNLMIVSPVPMILLWGPNGIMIYNGGYSEIAALRHPSILGAKVLEGWPEIADFNRNVLEAGLAGKCLSYRDQNLTLLRNGVPEQAWFDIDYSPVFGEGVPAGVLAVITETTDRVISKELHDRAERALVDSNRALEQANADLEQFAFSASHDLQEPLRMVSVYSQLLARRLSGKLDCESEVLLRHCIDGAMRMDNLIRDLLEYTRASADSIEDAPPVSLLEIVQHVLNLLEPSLKEVGAAVTTGFMPSLRIQAIHGQQIFHNLISNAIKYRSERPLRLHIGSTGSGNGYQLCVSDNGIGIDAAYHEQIFGLFKRLHSASEYKGTGIGLAICKKLVDRYGGRIWVESKLGEGSNFCFTLPLAQ